MPAQPRPVGPDRQAGPDVLEEPAPHRVRELFPRDGLAALRRQEIALLSRYAQAVGHGQLAPARVPVSEGSAVHVDGVDVAQRLFVEAHAYADSLDRTQISLVAQDLFKLALVARANPGGRAVLLLAGHAAARSLASMRRRVPSLAEVEIVVVS